jgi:hypothetical protein
MPIEIRELHIKVSVTSPESGQVSVTSASSGQNQRASSENSKEEIVAACVEKVMEILQNKGER